MKMGKNVEHICFFEQFSLIYFPFDNKFFFIIPLSDQTGGRSYIERVAGTFLCPEIIGMGIQSSGKAIEIVGYFQWFFPHPATTLILLGNLN